MKAWLNGEFVPPEQVTVPVLSHSFSRGSAVFEVLDVTASVGGAALFRGDDHVNRLFGSAEAMGMTLPIGRDELIDALKATVRANALAPAGLKVFAYFALPGLKLLPEDPQVDVAVFCYDPTELSGDNWGERTHPVAAGVSAVRRLDPHAVAIQAKISGHYVSAYMARLAAAGKGHGRVIMLDDRGFVAEGAASNIFFVSGGAVCTPTLRNVLAGITRDSVIELARDLGLDVQEKDILPADALRADEAFYTGTHIQLRPVESIDGTPIGSQCPGPVTLKLRQALADAYAGRDERYLKWLSYVE